MPQLCVIDTAPRHEFVAEQYNMLIQFAELCVREIEKDKVRRRQSGCGWGAVSVLAGLRTSWKRWTSCSCSSIPPCPLPLPPTRPPLQLMLLQKLVQQSAVSQPRSEVETVSPLGSLPGSLRTSGARSVTPAPSVRAAAQAAAQHKGEGEARPQHWGLTRAVDCFREGVMLVDVSTPTWGVLYANDAFTSTIGGWAGLLRGTAAGPRHQALAAPAWPTCAAPAPLLNVLRAAPCRRAAGRGHVAGFLGDFLRAGPGPRHLPGACGGQRALHCCRGAANHLQHHPQGHHCGLQVCQGRPRAAHALPPPPQQQPPLHCTAALDVALPPPPAPAGPPPLASLAGSHS